MVASADVVCDSKVFVDKAVRHVLLRQGVLGLQVKVMQPHDPTGKAGIKHNLPDIVCRLLTSSSS